MECHRSGVSRALGRERTPRARLPRRVRGVLSWRAAPSREGVPGCCPDAGAGAGGRRAGCAELRAALGAEQASVLPQVGDVGGPGDLMETKVK